MSTATDRTEILELYKLHAELADRVSQRREGANRLYVGLFAGLVGGFAALMELQGDEELSPLVTAAVGSFGALLSVSWFIVIRSYRQLNTGKFRALHELEEKLGYPFFTREWDLLREDDRGRPYWKLTVVETVLPCAFLLFSCGLLLWSFLR